MTSAVWRAANAVPDSDHRPTGPTQPAKAARRCGSATCDTRWETATPRPSPTGPASCTTWSPPPAATTTPPARRAPRRARRRRHRRPRPAPHRHRRTPTGRPRRLRPLVADQPSPLSRQLAACPDPTMPALTAIPHRRQLGAAADAMAIGAQNAVATASLRADAEPARHIMGASRGSRRRAPNLRAGLAGLGEHAHLHPRERRGPSAPRAAGHGAVVP